MDLHSNPTTKPFLGRNDTKKEGGYGESRELYNSGYSL